MSRNLFFAPVGIAHLTRSNADLVAFKALGRSCLRITTAGQLNGKPHMGTVLTVMGVFALARHLSDALGKPASVVFDALENAPAEQIDIDGETYTRSVGDLIDDGRLDPDERLGGFRRLLAFSSSRSGVAYEERSYHEYQRLSAVRGCLVDIARRQDAFRWIVAPADGIIKIRPRCPVCALLQKSGRDLVIHAADDGSMRLSSYCPMHGAYDELITADRGWCDANTPVRSIAKGALLSWEQQRHDACSVSIDGADWGGVWHAHVLTAGLATLGIPPHDWPVSLFTPLILDTNGGKFSKSLYVRHGAYSDLPEEYLNLDLLLERRGPDTLERLWHEVARWAAEPRRLHRSYTLDYITSVLED